MPSHLRSTNYGLLLEKNETRILLDPSKVESNDFVFISHAHSDHVYRKPRNKSKITTITSVETEAIANARGYEITNAIYEGKDLELIDSGHILGSKGLLAFNDTFYTGDISIRKRAFLKLPKKIPQVDTLIIESTFGLQDYIFPNHREIIHQANKIIADAYDKGHPVILMGYPLGKAQLLTNFFGHWDPFFSYDSIELINTVYRNMGISLRNTTCFTEAEKDRLLETKYPWIMLAPLMNGNSRFLKYMKEKYNTITIGFSGWACSPRYRFMMGIDHALPLSDHCDFNELIEVVKKCNPKKIYTIHGFAVEFARTLNNFGYNAIPISHKLNKTKQIDKKHNIRRKNDIQILDYFIK
jgi:putative mRNA 3-end processing factor